MKLLKTLLFLTALTFTLFSFSSEEKKAETFVFQSEKGTEVAYFASGCFWCVEAIFESVSGVEEAVSGYAGGHTKNPTYKSIGTGRTGHSETVAVYYNPKKVSFKTLVDVFYGSHNPTTVNGQYPDFGTQYRSIAFYKTEVEKQIINAAISKLNREKYNGKIVTEVTKFTKFYEAEEYHQNYEKLHPENPYIQKISIPRLNAFKSKFPHLLKKEIH